MPTEGETFIKGINLLFWEILWKAPGWIIRNSRVLFSPFLCSKYKKGPKILGSLMLFFSKSRLILGFLKQYYWSMVELVIKENQGSAKLFEKPLTIQQAELLNFCKCHFRTVEGQSNLSILRKGSCSQAYIHIGIYIQT